MSKQFHGFSGYVHLELAPKYWAHTRARLDPGELLREVGSLTIPPPLAPTAPVQMSSR